MKANLFFCVTFANDKELGVLTPKFNTLERKCFESRN